MGDRAGGRWQKNNARKFSTPSIAVLSCKPLAWPSELINSACILLKLSWFFVIVYFFNLFISIQAPGYHLNVESCTTANMQVLQPIQLLEQRISLVTNNPMFCSDVHQPYLLHTAKHVKSLYCIHKTNIILYTNYN